MSTREQTNLEPKLAEVEALAIATMNEHMPAGLALGIVHRGCVLYAKGFGLAQIEQERPVTLDTVFRIGSLSKTMTAIGLMQLWEQGAFGLDAPVNDYLKAFQILPPDHVAPPVTFRHLLTHTAGIGELRTLTDVFRPFYGWGVRLGTPIPALSAYYAGGLQAEVAAGMKWAYANHGFATIGQLIEEISGEPFAMYMRRHVFAPLGLEHTDYLRSESVRERLAAGYQFKRGRLEPVTDLEMIISGAGSVFSSLEDMLTYVLALLGGGTNAHGTILKPDTLCLMLQPHYQADERLAAAMGLGFMLDRFAGHPIVWHGGAAPGFLSSMYLAPADDLGIMILSNTENLTSRFAPELVGRALMSLLLGAPDPVASLPRPGIIETPHLWPELCGSYGPRKGFNTNGRLWRFFGSEFEVYVSGTHLALRALAGTLRKGIRLYRVDATDPLVFQGVLGKRLVQVVFHRNTEGYIDRLSLDVPGLYTLYKRPRYWSLRTRLRAALGGAVLAATGLGWLALTLKHRGEGVCYEHSDSHEDSRYQPAVTPT